jgi:hypothetical protein
MITTNMIKSIAILEKLKLTKKRGVSCSKNQEKLKKDQERCPRRVSVCLQ